MTICLVTNESASTGGIKTFNDHFVSLFPAHGHHVVLLTADTSSSIKEDVVEQVSERYVKVTLSRGYHQERQQQEPYFRPGGCDAPKYIAMGLAFRKWLFDNKDKYKIDIVEVSDHGGMGIFLCDKDLPPVVLTNHASNYHLSQYNYMCRDEHGRVIRKLELLSYRHSDAVITHSAAIARQFTDLSRKVYTALIPWQKNYETNVTDAEDAMVVGQLQVIKGPLLLCQSLQQLVDSTTNLRFRWYGNDTKTLHPGRSVYKYIQENFPALIPDLLQLENTRSQQQILEAMGKSAFIVVPSLWETFSYITLEAASLGKAIIITKTTGASSLFTHQENALVIDPETNALTNAIRMLQHDRQLRHQLGKNAKTMVSDLFTPGNIISERTALYKNVIHHREPPSGTFQENLSFLNRYRSYPRKTYFYARALLKRIFSQR